MQVVVPALLAGTARDTGSSPTDLLRPGLLLGKITSSGKWKEWNPTGTDGSEVIQGVLLFDQKMQDAGVDTDRWFGYALVRGLLKTSALIIPGNSALGLNADNNELIARSQLNDLGFMLDDEYMNQQFGWRKVVAKTGNYTVVELDNGTFFTTVGAAGAVTFTLPAPRIGFRFGFFVGADQNMTVAAAGADQIIGFNNLVSDSIAFTTAAEKIGGFVEMIGISSTKWAALVHLGSETQTPTIAA
jgi:hypothetical protein